MWWWWESVWENLRHCGRNCTWLKLEVRRSAVQYGAGRTKIFKKFILYARHYNLWLVYFLLHFFYFQGCFSRKIFPYVVKVLGLAFKSSLSSRVDCFNGHTTIEDKFTLAHAWSVADRMNLFQYQMKILRSQSCLASFSELLKIPYLADLGWYPGQRVKSLEFRLQ